MCLYISKESTFRMAVEDITVYKVVQRTTDIDDTTVCYLSPYHYAEYRIGEEIRTTISYGEVLERKPIKDIYVYDGLSDISYETKSKTHGIRYGIRTIESGLHTFVSLEDATTFMAYWYGGYCGYGGRYGAILECVIPKGTIYYKGEWLYDNADGDSVVVNSYASEKLKVNKEIS